MVNSYSYNIHVYYDIIMILLCVVFIILGINNACRDEGIDNQVNTCSL